MIGRCWTFTGATAGAGYGVAQFENVRTYVHRAAYETLVGPIPPGLEIDHLCRNKRCYNPAHLEPVTPAENKRRAAAAITACPAGHPYGEENTYVSKHGKRQCRACCRARDLVRRPRKGMGLLQAAEMLEVRLP